MIVIAFILSVLGAYTFGYYRGMALIERNWEGFTHYVDDILSELKIEKTKP